MELPRADVDPGGLLEYSVVFTDRSLNHMSQRFVGVMQEAISILTTTYAADALAMVPGGGTYAMEAVARQLMTGKHFTQTPQSNLRRLVSNIELIDEQPDGDIAVASNSLIFESSLRDDTLWAARNEYRLRHVDGDLRMAYKKVVLVNNDKAIYTLSFLV